MSLQSAGDPYGFAKVATRAASSEMGSAAACPTNVQNFFKTIFAMANSTSGLAQIDSALNLCQDSRVTLYDDVNQMLAAFVHFSWTSAVSYHTLPPTLPGSTSGFAQINSGLSLSPDFRS